MSTTHSHIPYDPLNHRPGVSRQSATLFVTSSHFTNTPSANQTRRKKLITWVTTDATSNQSGPKRTHPTITKDAPRRAPTMERTPALRMPQEPIERPQKPTSGRGGGSWCWREPSPPGHAPVPLFAFISGALWCRVTRRHIAVPLLNRVAVTENQVVWPPDCHEITLHPPHTHHHLR